MYSTAIIFVDDKSDENMERPRSSIVVGGISLLERQLRQLKRIGIERAILASFAMPDQLQDMTRGYKKTPELEHLDANFIDAAVWDGLTGALLLEEGVLIDDRILKAVHGTDGDATLAFFAPGHVGYGVGAGTKIDVDGAPRLFASVAGFASDVFKAAALERDFKENPVAAICRMGLKVPDCTIVDVSAMDPYLPDRRRDVDLLWRPVTGSGESRRATWVLIGMAQKGTLDWPARWVHPVFENVMTYYVAKTFLTPNMITVITAVAGAYIGYLFAVGQMGWAVAGALIVGVLDGVDGKLARTKMLQSPIGELEHVADKIVEYGWYFCMAYYFANATGTSGPWAVGWMIVLFAWAEVVQGEFFRRMTGRQLDDAGRFEQAFRLIGARRNTQIWALIPFGIAGMWLEGFWMIAIYAAVTFFVAQWRFIVRVRAYGSQVSDEIAENFRKSEYF